MSGSPPVIEIAGVWLPNKGAELMAHTVVDELGRRLPGARFVSAPQGNEVERRAIGIPGVVRADRKLDLPGQSRLRQLVRPVRVSHVIDISGFGYGDHWGVDKARRRAGVHVRAGRPVYLLPQAFGPFEDQALADEMRFIVAGVRFVAARDRTSRDHLLGLAPGREIRLLPDITLSLDLTRRLKAGPPFGALIANAKSSEGGTIDETGLVTLYVRLAALMRENGLEPRIVLHEPVADRALSERIASAAGLAIDDLGDARDIKAHLANARMVITGRFHGLANGLSMGVPCHAISWSHKYGELLDDFGRPDALFTGDADDFCRRVEAELSDASGRAQEQERLLRVALAKKVELETMWDQIAEDIQATV